MINAPNYQWRWTDPANELDRGTGAWAVRDVVLTIPEDLVATEDFETDPITGSGTWTVSAVTPHTGLRCLRSGVIAAGGITDYTFTIPVPATHIRFWWRVSSELNFDFFRVYKDAIIPGNLLLQASGTAPDAYVQTDLDITGATTVTFRYLKDGSGSAGLDRAIIDDIEWFVPVIPGTYFYEPLHLVPTNNHLKVTTGSEVVEIRPLDCLTDSVEACQSGAWTVAVSNFPASVEVSNDVGNPLPVTFPTGTLGNGAQTAVAAAAVQILAANASRKACLVQNVGLANMRVGVSGVTATTGFRLVPGQIVILEMPFVPTQAIFAIREGAVSTTALTQEIT